MVAVAGKSKVTAYLLWLFLGWCSAHKFYLGKTGIGILYFLTGQLAGIGWLLDLFTLGSQVDKYNLLHGLHTKPGAAQNMQSSNQSNQNIVVNVAAPSSDTSAAQTKISAEKQILALSEKISVLTIKQIISQTSLEMEEAEAVIKKLVEKGVAKEQVGQDGKMTYDFS
jgi:selenocysteine lyase/cysteine desulfurase